MLLGDDFTKNRKDAGQPITLESAKELAEKCATKKPEDSLLDMPCKSRISELVRHDFEAANIERKTKDGKATFHSFRTNYVNAVVCSGGTVLKSMMTLARHGSAKMTIQVYADKGTVHSIIYHK